MQDNSTNQSSGSNAKPSGRFSTLSFSSSQQRPSSQPAATQPRSFFSSTPSTSSTTPSSSNPFQSTQNSLFLNNIFNSDLNFFVEKNTGLGQRNIASTGRNQRNTSWNTNKVALPKPINLKGDISSVVISDGTTSTNSDIDKNQGSNSVSSTTPSAKSDSSKTQGNAWTTSPRLNE